MIKSSPFFRSRRRRASLALFGSALQRTTVEPTAYRLWSPEDGRSEALGRELPNGDARHDAELHEVIARLRREARIDHRLRHADEDECNRLIDESVRALWTTSRVKSFVPLFAMQRVREHFGFDRELNVPAPDGLR